MTHLEEYLDFTEDGIRIKGNRIGLGRIVHEYREGATAEDIVRDYPGLSLEKVYAALTYYLRNKAAVDAAIAEEEAESEAAYAAWAADPPEPVRRLMALRAAQSASEE